MNGIQENLQEALGDRYEVERVLGWGGMATVFLARDRKHERRVAIKVLTPEVAASVGSERFLREIQIAAGLQHPHIIPLYDSGAGHALIYYVMPYVEGESLKERIEREGALSLREALEVASEVASALEYAHQRGLVHRDIKPENILLSQGHAMVTDFGVARALTAAGPGLTQVGSILGTPEYMSPEQVSSGEHVDGRADVYSLGCVLYEMLTGRPAHTGPTVEAVFTQLFTGEIPSIRDTRSDLPRWPDDVVARATARDRNLRYASAAEFRAALEPPLESTRGPWWRRRPTILASAGVALVIGATAWLLWPPGELHRVHRDADVIAVLPFVTEGPGVDMLGQGMADLLATNLDGVGGIRTIDPRTVMRRVPRRVQADLHDRQRALDLGREVDAESVLLGSLVSVAGVVRATAELYAVGGALVARAMTEGPIDSLFALADSLSLRLMREIWRSEEPVPELRVAAITTGSLEAIRSFLRGEQFFRESEWALAITEYDDAVQSDSTFALALLRLSMCYGWVGGRGNVTALSYADAAARHADHLPGRERLLIEANRLFSRGELATVDSLRVYAERYPADPEGWFLLGEAQFHAQPLLGLTPAELYAPFDRVLLLDSTLSPAALSPLELSLVFVQPDRFEEYHRRLTVNGDRVAERRYEFLRDVAWGDIPPSVPEMVGAVREHGLGILGAMADLALVTGTIRVDTLLQVMSSESLRVAAEPGEEDMTDLRLGLLVAAGRLSQATALLDSLWQTTPQAAARFALRVAIAGFPGWDPGERALTALGSADTNDPSARYLEAAYAVAQGRPDRARRILRNAPGERLTSPWSGLFAAVAGWSAIVEGDTLEGLAGMRQGLIRAGFEPTATFAAAPIRFQLARLLLARPEFRDEGRLRLRYDWYLRAAAPYLYPMQLLTLAETPSDSAEARESRQRLTELWRTGDPAVRLILRPPDPGRDYSTPRKPASTG